MLSTTLSDSPAKLQGQSEITKVQPPTPFPGGNQISGGEMAGNKRPDMPRTYLSVQGCKPRQARNAVAMINFLCSLPVSVQPQEPEEKNSISEIKGGPEYNVFNSYI